MIPTTSPASNVSLALIETLSIWATANCPPVILFINSELGVVGIIIEPLLPPGQETCVISFCNIKSLSTNGLGDTIISPVKESEFTHAPSPSLYIVTWYG